MTKKSKDSTTAKTEPEVKTEVSPVEEVNASKRGKKKRPYPIESFEESIEFCKTLYHLGAGDKVRRLTLFDKLGKSPDSGPSRMLIITANKYGLIKGNAQSEFLELSPNGLKAVSDEIPKDAAFKAKFELCITQIDIYNFLYTKYAGSKLPSFAVIYDLLKDQFKDKGLDDQDTHAIVETFIVNIKFLGLLQLISGAERIITIEHALESIPSISIPSITTITKTDSKTIDLIEVDASSQVGKVYDSYDNICFYITPIGQEDSEHRMHSNLFLESIITPVIEQFGLKVVRADGIDKPGTITNQIIEYIFKSKLVVADLSFHNPNVFYELALRHVSRMPTVQIVRKSDFIPFDLSNARTILIDNTSIYTLIPKLETYKAEIANQIRQALNNPESVDNPVTNVFPKLRVNLG